MPRKRSPKDRPEHESTRATPSRASGRSTSEGRGESRWARAKTRSASRRTGSRGEHISDIEALLAEKRWRAAHKRIAEELTLAPADHWLWAHLSLTSYELRDYGKAVAYARRAVELQPDCPLALWHYAGALSMNGKEDAALAVWLLILGMDLDAIANGDSGEGMDWALQLVNDVHYRMARLYEWKGEPEQGMRSLEKYLHNRAHGVASIYDEGEARKRLGALSRSGGRAPTAGGAR